jgi:thioesterase domain-containing protein
MPTLKQRTAMCRSLTPIASRYLKPLNKQMSGQDSTLGWSTLTKDVQLHPVPGNHLSLLKQPHVQTLAQQLRPYLA